MNLSHVKSQLQSESTTTFLAYGEEEYYLDELAHVVDEIMPEAQKDFNYHILYGRDVEATQVVDLASRIPMGAPRQYVVLREAQSMRGFEKLADYVARPSPTTLLVIIYKKKIDKRKKAIKTILQHAQSAESKTPYENQLPSWIKAEADRRNIQLDSSAVRTLSAYVGVNLKGIADALEKLSLNSEQGQVIGEDLVSKMIGINREYNIFSLQSAIAARDRALCMQILQYYAGHTKETPLVLVINSLYGFFLQLCDLRQKGAQSEGDIRRITGVRHPGALRDYGLALQHYGMPQLTKVMHALHLADLHSKGVQRRNADASAVLKELVGKILSY